MHGNVRFPRDHNTDIKCRCGGHSLRDRKKNVRAHSTRVRLARRMARLAALHSSTPVESPK